MHFKHRNINTCIWLVGVLEGESLSAILASPQEETLQIFAHVNVGLNVEQDNWKSNQDVFPPSLRMCGWKWRTVCWRVISLHLKPRPTSGFKKLSWLHFRLVTWRRKNFSRALKERLPSICAGLELTEPLNTFTDEKSITAKLYCKFPLLYIKRFSMVCFSVCLLLL